MCIFSLDGIDMDATVILKSSFTIPALTAWVQGTALHPPLCDIKSLVQFWHMVS